MNAQPESDVLEVLKNSWDQPHVYEGLATHPAPSPRRQIDYILLRSLTEKKISISTKVMEEPIASDHRPIFMSIGLPSVSR
jgi:endonuclease/exonuclease/phosphatase family metal-dependent hydrolase